MKTLLRHSAIYLVARGVPGIVSFLGIALFTRLLPPSEYGRFALVVASIGVFHVLLFQWLSVSLVRYLPGGSQPQQLLATIRFAYWRLVALTALVGTIALVWAPANWRLLVFTGMLLLWTQAWFEINLQALRAKLAPTLFGLASGLKSILTLVVGVLLIKWIPNALTPTLGQVVGCVAASALVWRILWSNVGNRADMGLLREVARYGAPLAGTLVLANLLGYSDRFLIAYFMDEQAAGAYAAAYDLTAQALTVVMMIVNTAAYPLIVKDLEEAGVGVARQRLAHNIWLLLVAAAPVALLMALFPRQVARVALGSEFRQVAIALLPWITVASVLNGVRSYYFDLAFQLGRTTALQLWVVAGTLVVNLILNIVWLPRVGVIGAAWSTFAGYVVALMVSAFLGRRVFPLPANSKGILQVGIAVAMALGVWLLLPNGTGAVYHGLQMLTVMATYSFALAAQVLIATGLTRRMRRSYLHSGDASAKEVQA